MVEYKSFKKNEFLHNLIEISKKLNMGYVNECTDQIKKEHPDKEFYEYIYMFNTDNQWVKVLIYSSVDLRTGETREIGSDAVRLVYRWKIKDGILYKRIKKHQRIETLFKNMEDTLRESCIDCNVFGSKGWCKSDEFEI